jgi:uncharacterized membrane protein
MLLPRILSAMTTDTAEPYVRLATELRRLGHQLDAMGAELLRLRSTAVPAAAAAAAAAAAPGPGPAPAASYPTGPLQAGPYPGSAAPGGPYPGLAAPGGPYPGFAVPGGPYPNGPVPTAPHPVGLLPAPAPKPARPRAFSALSGARLLAWTGAAVTLLGVVLLLVLAASRGWFSPPARIGAGAVLGLALVGLGWWLHRRENARTGAVALAATGFATLYLVVAAATAFYEYLGAVPALLIAFLVAACGLGLADRWRVQLLAGGVVVGAALLAPVLATGWLLVALVLALQLAALPVVLRRKWSVLMLVAAAGPVLYGLVVGLDEGGAGRPATIAVALGVLAAGGATAALATGVLDRRPVATLVAATPVPVMATGTALAGWSGGALAAVAALAMGALAARAGTDRVIRTVAASAAALALFQATVIALDGATVTAVVLGEAIVAAVLAGTLRARFPLVVSMIYGLFGVSHAVGEDAPLGALVQFPEASYVGASASGGLVTAAAVSALVLALAVALLAAGGRLGWIRPDAQTAMLWVPIGLVGLYGAASFVVTLALLVSPDRAGFTAGHALVTVSWTVAALVLLARGISRAALRITGMVLVAAAVAKLVLFDLVALDGIARVAAFLGAGLVLLAAGTRYARMVAEANAAAERSAEAPPPPSR